MNERFIPGRRDPDPADAARATLDAKVPEPPEAGLTDKQKRYRKIGRRLALAFSVGLAVLSVYVLAQTVAQFSLASLRAAIAATSAEQIFLASILTAISFLALTGYDALALHQLHLRVPYKTTALASFTSYAISFTLGFPLITGGTVRYWIYSQVGLSAGKVASLTLVAGVTFWLGMALVIGVGLVFRGGALGEVDHLEPAINMLIGIGILGTILAYLVWISLGLRRTTIQGFKLKLPGLRVTLGQMMLGVIDLCAAAGVLFVLLPPPRSLDYLTFVATYVFACLLGIASNAPGGIGVFEAAMLKAVPATSQEALFASLLLFRCIYYLAPFVLAMAFLGAHESVKRWQSLREAMRGDVGGSDDPD